MSTNGLVYAPSTPDWAKFRTFEYLYQVSLIADNPAYLRHYMVATHAMQTQSLLTSNAQLLEVNRGILGIQHGSEILTAAARQGYLFSDEDMKRQNAIIMDVAKQLSKKMEGEIREIRNSALSAVREGCSPEAFDQEGSLREALQLFRITVEHPTGMRDYVAWFNIGWLLWKLDGNLDEAEKAFATAVRQSMEKKDAYHVMAARHLAYMRFLLGKTEGAYQGIRLALHITSDDPENLFAQMLIAAQATNVEELITAFRTMVANHPEWLVVCLAEPELNPFQAQLQPVVDALVEDARMQVREMINKVKAKLQEIDDKATPIPYTLLLSATNQQKITAIKARIDRINVSATDWLTLDSLFIELMAVNTDAIRIGDEIRPIYDLITSMVTIPAGDFLYGEKKYRKFLPAFSITKHPITVAQYRQFCDITGREMPHLPRECMHDDLPIVYVSWHDAVAFAEWVGLALPTEEEWEKAARGTDGREYPWGNEWDASKCSNRVEDIHSNPRLVGKHPTGASPYGVEDMVGNVEEWCDNWYEIANTRVLRGGSTHYDSDTFRITYRYKDRPTCYGRCRGFRCVSRSPGQ